MRAIRQKMFGRLLTEKSRAALWLGDEETAGFDLLYLRYALTLRGTESSVFPAEVLDDWGNERTGLALYKWIREEGERFPRGELFGFDIQGKGTQHFLREFELFWRYPLYAYTNKSTPVEQGTLVEAVFLTNDTLTAPAPIDGRPNVKPPLRRTRVKWWQAPTSWLHESFTFSILDQ